MFNVFDLYVFFSYHTKVELYMYANLLCSMIEMNSHKHLSSHKEPDSGAGKLFISRALAWHDLALKHSL